MFLYTVQLHMFDANMLIMFGPLPDCKPSRYAWEYNSLFIFDWSMVSSSQILKINFKYVHMYGDYIYIYI